MCRSCGGVPLALGIWFVAGVVGSGVLYSTVVRCIASIELQDQQYDARMPRQPDRFYPSHPNQGAAILSRAKNIYLPRVRSFAFPSIFLRTAPTPLLPTKLILTRPLLPRLFSELSISTELVPPVWAPPTPSTAPLPRENASREGATRHRSKRSVGTHSQHKS